jgi:ketosteroid isomerase-like protein
MTNTVEREIVAHEEQLTNASRALDFDTLDRLYAEDMMMTNVLGETCRGKEQLMDEARRGAAVRNQAAAAGKPITTAYAKEDLTVFALGDAAVAGYRFVVDITGNGIDIHRRYRTTNIWAKRDGRWQVVAAHTAFVLDPKQVARLAGQPG